MRGVDFGARFVYINGDVMCRAQMNRIKGVALFYLGNLQRVWYGEK